MKSKIHKKQYILLISIILILVNFTSITIVGEEIGKKRVGQQKHKKK